MYSNQEIKQNGLSKTALFQQFLSSQENDMWFFQNTHTNKQYKALPCSIKPRKMNDHPLIMAQIISKYSKGKKCMLKIEVNNDLESPYFGRNFTPKLESRSHLLSSHRKRSKQRNNELNSSLDEAIKHKQRTPKPIKAELYFSRNLRDAIRSPRMTLTIPQYIAQKKYQSKMYN